ncbi:50S ribosomal protein L17 [Lentilactobacillus senioris]|uniref:50S ribosomal protein L17 n=1 Tax=Lentilactobacillus senioris TaxID=931534 RepID=UPI0006D08354|nr:50S ribosomal protein L17 [Lentilactobacillus senioris]
MSYRKLQRTSEHRKALLRNLTTDLIVNGQIVTTEAKAKEVRSTADKMISLGKRGGDLHARRQAAAFLRDVVADVNEDGDNVTVTTALQKVFGDLATKYADRNGGYTRIYKTMPRRGGDGAQMVILQLVD